MTDNGNEHDERSTPSAQRLIAPWVLLLLLSIVLVPLVVQRNRVAFAYSSAIGLFERKIVALDEPFTLHHGGRAIVRETSASLRLTGFINNPCPKNAVCAWSGQAVSYTLFVGRNAYPVRMGSVPDDAPYAVTVVRSNFRTQAEFRVRRSPNWSDPALRASWDIVLPAHEMSAADLTRNHLLYAMKEGRTVTVFQKNLASGKEAMLLRYDEDRAAAADANLWNGLPPNVALAPGGRTLAYNRLVPI